MYQPWHFLHTISLKKKRMKEGAWSLYIYVQNHNTLASIIIYNASTLHGKQLLSKHDQLWSHKSAVYHPDSSLSC